MDFKHIIIHCSASAWGCARTIREWHKEKGWSDIGYHFTVLNGRVNSDLYLDCMDGALECGRFLNGDNVIDDNEVGAHALGYNRNSIGVCMIGGAQGDDFTVAQYSALTKLLIELCRRWNISPDNVLGHYETEQAHGKTCPNFDVRGYREVLKYEMERLYGSN